MTRVEAERARLQAVPNYDPSYSLQDLVETPDAAWRAAYLGEFFYGATPEAALAKAEEFARDNRSLGDFRASVVPVDPLPEPPEPVPCAHERWLDTVVWSGAHGRFVDREDVERWTS